LKLNLALVAAAALLSLTDTRWLVALTGMERFALSPTRAGLVFAAAGIGGFSVFAAAVWVDRLGPHPMIAIGAAIMALGSALHLVAGTVPLFYGAAFIGGVGGGLVGAVVFYAVAAKASTRHRGALIGALVMVLSIRPRFSSEFADTGISVPLLIGGAALAGVILYWCAPRLRGPQASETDQPRFELRAALLSWTQAKYALGIFAIAVALSGATETLTSWLIWQQSGTPDSAYSTLSSWRIISAVSALVWGIASDFMPIRNLLITSALLSIVGLGVAALANGAGTLVLGASIASIARGGLFVLPWLLLLAQLPHRYLATGAAVGSLVASIPGALLGPASAGILVSVAGPPWATALYAMVAMGLIYVVRGQARPTPVAVAE
jgi:MFS family permease